MKVLQLNTFDEWGGAAKAASRLHEGLLGVGVDSRLVVQAKTGAGCYVTGSRGPLAKLRYAARAYLDTLPVRCYPKRPIYNFTPALVPDRLAGIVADAAPDLIHLHWMAVGFMRIETLRRLQRPLVWTLHDSWAFTGGCHIPHDCLKYRQSCGACPVLGSGREHDLSRWTWRRKREAWRGLDLTVVSPSRWLADCARSSSLFAEVPIRVIPNGIDLSVFTATKKGAARELLGLPQGKKYILFGAMNSTSDPNKGFRLLLPSLKKVATSAAARDAELLVFGASAPADPPDFGMKATYLGRLREDARIALLYSAADLLVVPSLLENLPNMIMEAMACGTPCVAFDQGGVGDLIEHGSSGYLARAYDPDDLARGMVRLLEDDRHRAEVAERARREAEGRFALEKVAQRYADLYRELLGGER
jgi:glycosyltransferase involved in cell wall biosynthesis